jgi:predicted RNase H-like nuclease
MRNPDVIETDLGDELVLLDPKTRAMFTLNATGREVWRHAEDELDQIVSALTTSFAITADRARGDIVALIAELTSAGLVLPSR